MLSSKNRHIHDDISQPGWHREGYHPAKTRRKSSTVSKTLLRPVSERCLPDETATQGTTHQHLLHVPKPSNPSTNISSGAPVTASLPQALHGAISELCAGGSMCSSTGCLRSSRLWRLPASPRTGGGGGQREEGLLLSGDDLAVRPKALGVAFRGGAAAISEPGLGARDEAHWARRRVVSGQRSTLARRRWASRQATGRVEDGPEEQDSWPPSLTLSDRMGRILLYAPGRMCEKAQRMTASGMDPLPAMAAQ
jgi:hypothetical protein